jgi:hypothetical protein
MTKHLIEVEIEDGTVDATLTLDGCPIAGHADSTGSLTASSLIDTLVRTLVDRVESDRRLPSSQRAAQR